jgi:formylglycine-generating enzyme required for sulfatase activity
MTKTEPEKKGHQVFISYSNEESDKTDSDRKIADMICSALENEGIRCWIAHRDILAGEDWLDSIVDAVEQSKMIVLIFSSNTEKSQYVKDEIKLALDNKMRIIPFRIEDFPPKGAYKILKLRSQWIDAFTPPLENHVDRLVRDVRTYLEKDKENEKETETKEKLPLKDKPGDVEAVDSKAKRVYKNQQGFQETDFGDGIIMVSIPPGEFKMGSNEFDSEKPLHTVYLDEYRIGKYAVTVKQFGLFVKDTGYVTEAESSGGAYTWTGETWEKRKDINWKNPGFEQEGSHPVVCVSWNDALEYCKWLSGTKKGSFKLPTEAQWEKAARGTDKRKYPWGNPAPSGERANFADKQAWVKAKISWADKDIDDGHAYTAPLGSYPAGASPYGLLDMAGNVWEWCGDWYDENYYKNSPKKNPLGPDGGTLRVLRGGGWFNDAESLRCTFRGYHYPSDRFDYVGFRLCQDD